MAFGEARFDANDFLEHSPDVCLLILCWGFQGLGILVMFLQEFWNVMWIHDRAEISVSLKK